MCLITILTSNHSFAKAWKFDIQMYDFELKVTDRRLRCMVELDFPASFRKWHWPLVEGWIWNITHSLGSWCWTSHTTDMSWRFTFCVLCREINRWWKVDGLVSKFISCLDLDAHANPSHLTFPRKVIYMTVDSLWIYLMRWIQRAKPILLKQFDAKLSMV